MESEVADFLQYCRVERRLAELTCSAYERDVRACVRFLQAEGVTAWQAVGPAHLRRFLADEALRRRELGFVCVRLRVESRSKEIDDLDSALLSSARLEELLFAGAYRSFFGGEPRRLLLVSGWCCRRASSGRRSSGSSAP